MSERQRADTVAVLGLGDLGTRVVQALARLPLGRLVAVARDAGRAERVAGQAALVAALAAGAEQVEAAAADLRDVDATAGALARAAPDVIVMAASAHTWWRTPPALAGVPYAVWLPLHVGLVGDVVRARDAAGIAAPVVALPYPDAVGPALAPAGLAPDLGAGNVAEVAAKLEVLAARRAGVPRGEVACRLVLHHAAERLAFATFAGLGGAEGSPARPPLRAEITVAGRRLDQAEVLDLLTAPHPLLEGRDSHGLTAEATAAVVAALLADAPVRVHAPAPAGRPGGYPLRVSRAGIALDLPDDLTEPDAIAINAAAARWDGIDRIHPDGGVTFTRAAADAAERALGLRLEHVGPEEMEPVAAELAARLAAARAGA